MGSGISDYKGARTHKSIVDTMLGEHKPVITTIESIAEVTSPKPSFVYVGQEVPKFITALAKSKKSQMTF